MSIKHQTGVLFTIKITVKNHLVHIVIYAEKKGGVNRTWLDGNFKQKSKVYV